MIGKLGDRNVCLYFLYNIGLYGGAWTRGAGPDYGSESWLSKVCYSGGTTEQKPVKRDLAADLVTLFGKAGST